MHEEHCGVGLTVGIQVSFALKTTGLQHKNHDEPKGHPHSGLICFGHTGWQDWGTQTDEVAAKQFASEFNDVILLFGTPDLRKLLQTANVCLSTKRNLICSVTEFKAQRSFYKNCLVRSSCP